MSSFHNRQRAAQLIDFKGLSWGKLRPTDIDLSIDWKGKTWVFCELKGKYQELTVGQRIHLEGLVKGLKQGGKTAYAVFARHATSAREDVIAADCFDCMVYDGNTWETTHKALGEVLEDLYQSHITEYES